MAGNGLEEAAHRKAARPHPQLLAAKGCAERPTRSQYVQCAPGGSAPEISPSASRGDASLAQNGAMLCERHTHSRVALAVLEYYQYIFTSSQSMEDLRLLQHMPLNLATQLALSVNARFRQKMSLIDHG